MKSIYKKRQIKKRRNLYKVIVETKALYYVSIFRSNKYLYATVYEVKTKKALYGLSEKSVIKSKNKTKSDRAYDLGVLFADKLKKNKHDSIVINRSSYSYLGRVKSFVEGLREGGIQV